MKSMQRLPRARDGAQPRVAGGSRWDSAELGQADALDPATLPAALAGVDVAYYLVHAMAAGRDFGAIARRAAGHFARAAAAAGLRRIVYLGGLIPPNPRSAHLKYRAVTGDAGSPALATGGSSQIAVGATVRSAVRL